MKVAKLQRLWELDFMRGIAILLMVAYHLYYDLRYFAGFTELSKYETFWKIERILAGGSFIFLAGMLTAVIAKNQTFSDVFQKNRRRGLRLIGWGLLITLITLLLAPGWTIWFGILHFLGVAILFSSFFIRLQWMNLMLGLLFLFAGSFLNDLTAPHWWGLPFGIRPTFFQSFDYYPLFPWFGVLLIGLGLGNLIYSRRESLIHRPPSALERPFNWLGKYSLWIYLVHQPILLGILWFFLKKG